MAHDFFLSLVLVGQLKRDKLSPKGWLCKKLKALLFVGKPGLIQTNTTELVGHYEVQTLFCVTSFVNSRFAHGGGKTEKYQPSRKMLRIWATVRPDDWAHIQVTRPQLHQVQTKNSPTQIQFSQWELTRSRNQAHWKIHYKN